MEREESSKEAPKHRSGWGCSCWKMWSWAHISTWDYFGFTPCSVWLCLGGPWKLARNVSLHLQTLRNPGGCGEPENGAGLSSACCCLPWIWRKTFPKCYCFAWSLQSSSQERTEGFCILLDLVPAVPHWLLCTCVWCLQAVGVPSLATQQPIHPWPLTFYFLTHPKALGSSLKSAIPFHFSDCC